MSFTKKGTLIRKANYMKKKKKLKFTSTCLTNPRGQKKKIINKNIVQTLGCTSTNHHKMRIMNFWISIPEILKEKILNN